VADPSGQTFSLRTGGGHDVTLDLPDGRRTTFYYYLAPGFFGAKPMWQAPPGVYDQLSLIDSNLVLTFISPGVEWWSDGQSSSVDNHDFSGFLLTTQDGTQYRVDRDDLGTFDYAGATISDTYAHVYGT